MDYFGSRWRPVACCCLYGNEYLGFIKRREFVYYPNNCQHITKNSPLSSWLGPIIFPVSFSVPFFLSCSLSYSVPSPPAHYHSSSACPLHSGGPYLAHSFHLSAPSSFHQPSSGAEFAQPAAVTAANNVRQGSNLASCLLLSHCVDRDPNMAWRYYGRCL
jgi:hypothetical protein